jgi:hypothetical protein
VAERCPTCLRPVFEPGPGAKPDPLKHCPRALMDHTAPESQQVYTVCCLAVGVTTRDAMLEKARELLKRVGQTLDDVVKESTCAGSESPIASPTPAASDAATPAVSGGLSPNATAEHGPGRTTAPGSAATARPSNALGPIVIDGWRCDPANPFGHSVCREVRQMEGEWPAALVLSSGDGSAQDSKAIDVPPRVLAWLLTGEAPDEAGLVPRNLDQGDPQPMKTSVERTA